MVGRGVAFFADKSSTNSIGGVGFFGAGLATMLGKGAGFVFGKESTARGAGIGSSSLACLIDGSTAANFFSAGLGRFGFLSVATARQTRGALAGLGGSTFGVENGRESLLLDEVGCLMGRFATGADFGVSGFEMMDAIESGSVVETGTLSEGASAVTEEAGFS